MKIIASALFFLRIAGDKIEAGSKDGISAQKRGVLDRAQQQEAQGSDMKNDESSEKENDSGPEGEYRDEDEVKKPGKDDKVLVDKELGQKESEEDVSKKDTSLEDPGEDSLVNLETPYQENVVLDPNTVFKIEIKIKKKGRTYLESILPGAGNASLQENTAKHDNQPQKVSSSRSIDARSKSTIPQKAGGYLTAKNNKDSHEISKDKDTQGHESAKPSIHTASRSKDIYQPSTKKAEDSSTSIKAPPLSVGPLQNLDGGMSVLCIISKNMDLIKSKIKYKNTLNRISDVLIYKDQDKKPRDYWGRLTFNNTDGKYVDETGFYEGKLVSSVKEILEKGRLTKNGFYQSKDIPPENLEKGFETSKFLIGEIAKERKMAVKDVLSEECNHLSSADRLIFSRQYPKRPKPIKKSVVCVCIDNFCKEPCGDIRMVDPKHLE